jgi:hypothetical protein
MQVIEIDSMSEYEACQNAGEKGIDSVSEYGCGLERSRTMNLVRMQENRNT